VDGAEPLGELQFPRSQRHYEDNTMVEHLRIWREHQRAATAVRRTTALGYTHRSQLTARFLGCESVWRVELVG